MLSIEQALDRYTYEVQAGNSECLNSIVAEVNSADRQEFMESAQLIRALFSQKQMKGFDNIFERVNRKKMDLEG